MPPKAAPVVVAKKTLAKSKSPAKIVAKKPSKEEIKKDADAATKPKKQQKPAEESKEIPKGKYNDC